MELLVWDVRVNRGLIREEKKNKKLFLRLDLMDFQNWPGLISKTKHDGCQELDFRDF